MLYTCRLCGHKTDTEPPMVDHFTSTHPGVHEWERSVVQDPAKSLETEG